MTAGGVIVVKVGGATIEDPQVSGPLLAAVARLGAMKPTILVHGGGKAVDRMLERLGFTTERREGLRITPPEQVEVIVGVLAGTVNKQVVGRLNGFGARGVGLCLGDGAAVRTRRATGLSFDPGCVGEVAWDASQAGGERGRGDGSLLRTLVASGYLPVVSSIGLDDAGGFLNVNADEAAAGIARVVGAAALVLLTDVPGVLDERGQPIAELDAAGVEALIARGVVTGGMIPKVRAAVATAASAGSPVVIMRGTGESLSAWSDGGAVGTRIVPSSRGA